MYTKHPLTMRSTTTNPGNNNKGKLALCFLLYDTVEHAGVWESFLENHEDRCNIYSHPKMVTDRTPDWIKKAKISRPLKTGWCDESLVFAYLKMVKKAMEDLTNKYFAIVSGTCIPLHKFDTVYEKVFKYPQSRIYYLPKKESVVFNGEDLNPHYQWMILNRKQAKDALRLLDKTDARAQAFLKMMRAKYRFHAKHETWYSYCMDELYLGEWFVTLYGGKTVSPRFTKEVKQSKPTFADFKSWDDMHPIVFTRRALRADGDKKLKQMKRSSIFARKFTKDAAQFILTTY